MSKARKNVKGESKQGLDTLGTLTCTHFSSCSEIEFYSSTSGKAEVIADRYDAPHMAAKEIAELVVRAMNAFPEMTSLIEEMRSAFELCLRCNGKLTWEAEQELTVLCERAKKGGSVMIVSQNAFPFTSFRVIDIMTSDDDKRFAPAGQMAAAIISISLSKGSCLPTDLFDRGFTEQDIKANWHMAESIALIEMKIAGAQQSTPALSKEGENS